MLYDWILTNKELLKIIYALIICFICAIIVLKTDRLFKLSDYQGLRYLRNAFFFYGIAFFVRFILGAIIISNYQQIYPILIKIIFNFSIIMAGMFLFYSLIWKKVEKKQQYSSLLNFNIGILYLISIIITIFDYLLTTNLFMYVSQIILFTIMAIISYNNYTRAGRKHKFLKYYFLTMILGLLAWILNTALFYFLNWNKIVQMQVYALNIIFFLFFLYGITKFTKSKNG
jgi:hypothetical protein